MSTRKCVIVVLMGASAILPTPSLRAQTCMQKLTASDAAEGDTFGSSVSISDERVLVGAPYDDDAGLTSGSAYVFRIDDNGTPSDPSDDFWFQEGKLVPSQSEAGESLGGSVSISGVRAAFGRRSGGGAESDPVYVFRRDDNGTPSEPGDDFWAQEARLTAVGGSHADFFGSVSINGPRLVVGAHGDDSAGWGTGAAYVFRYDDNGTPNAPNDDSWIQEAKLIASDASGGDFFGSSVSTGGDRVVVGAYGDDYAGTYTGSAYVFRHDDNGTPSDPNDDFWVQEAKLSASYASGGDYFGLSVSIDGDWVLVGAKYDDDAGTDSGAAYVFRIDDNGTPSDPSDDFWMQEARLVASDAETEDRFGGKVSISGGRAIVSALGKDGAGARPDAGAAYVFRLDDNGTPSDPSDDFWFQEAKLTATDPAESDYYYGASVAVSGDRLVAGATGNDHAGSGSGAAYVVSLRPESVSVDCDGNGLDDSCDLDTGRAEDCNSNGVPDECDISDGSVPDCNGNRLSDVCDVAQGRAEDCNGNGVPDECDIAQGVLPDCNDNIVPDACDIVAGTSQDVNDNGVPDECEIAGACCFIVGGVCTHATAIDCLASGGEPGEAGTACMDETHPDGVACSRFRIFWVPQGETPSDIPQGPTVVDASTAQGTTLTVELFIENGPVPVRRVAVELDCRTSGVQGTVTAVEAVSDVTRPDHIFLGASHSKGWKTDDCPEGTLRGAAARTVGGAFVGAPRYLGEVTFAISDDGCGPFVFDFLDLGTAARDLNLEIIAGLTADSLVFVVDSGMDCNDNGVSDTCDIGSGTSADTNGDGVPDECCTDHGACADESVCTFDWCIEAACSSQDAVYADVAGVNGTCGPDGTIDIFDIFAVLDAFKETYTEGCALPNLDIAEPGGCGRDGTVDLFDIFAVLDAFRDVAECCATP